ncbi:hypothetical protein DV735_g5078, partial [Chaetothyriales sp. CBS 134920]
MLLTPSLAFSPPPSTSLLPGLSPVENAAQFQNHVHPSHPHSHAHHHARRPKHTPNPRSTLALLAADERAVAQRKLAIAISDEMGEISGVSEGWVYDTNREQDSDEEEIARNQMAFAAANVPRLTQQSMRAQGHARAPASDSNERDLDDDVPEADDGGWEHTDSELEDSEMDISILPSGHALPFSSSRRSSARVFSGNAAAAATSQHRPMHPLHTPQLSSATDTRRPDSAASEVPQSGSTRRNWLDAARAGRNLFGISRTPQNAGAGSSFFTPSPAAADRPEPGTAETDEGRAPRRTGRFLGRRRRENRDSID